VAATVHRYLEVKKDTQVRLQCAAVPGRGMSPTVPPLSSPQVIEIIQTELDRANGHYAPVEQVKKFFILEHDLTQETGELTPTMKVKRNVVEEKYGERFDALYEA
jgi:long-chain acyl-CoA synthetase